MLFKGKSGVHCLNKGTLFLSFDIITVICTLFLRLGMINTVIALLQINSFSLGCYILLCNLWFLRGLGNGDVHDYMTKSNKHENSKRNKAMTHFK